MQEREIFSELRTTSPILVRLDGRSFHHLAKDLALKRPFDEKFHTAMREVCISLISRSGIAVDFAYTFSDEISLYIRTLPFTGRIEKLNSVLASYAASALTIALGVRSPLAFDSRIIPITPESAEDYLISRQAEAWRNHSNAYSQAALHKEGMTEKEVEVALRGKQTRDLHELMWERGINLSSTPAWQRRGILIYKRLTEVMEFTQGGRGNVISNEEIPLFTSPEGRSLIRQLITD